MRKRVPNLSLFGMFNKKKLACVFRGLFCCIKTLVGNLWMLESWEHIAVPARTQSAMGDCVTVTQAGGRLLAVKKKKKKVAQSCDLSCDFNPRAGMR